MSAERCDVVVAGGGPAGIATAVALARKDFDVRLVEPGPAPPVHEPLGDELRFYALSPATFAFLTGLGCWCEPLARRAAAYATMRVWDLDPEHELRFEARDIGRAELGWIVDHGSLTAALLQGFAPACRRATRVTGLARAGARTRVSLEDGSVLDAALVVAADGANSPLRTAAGIGVQGWAYPQQALVANVRWEHPHEDTAWQRFLPSGPLALLPLRDGQVSIVWSARDTHARALLESDDARFGEELAAAIDGRFGRLRALGPRKSFPLHWSHAEAYVRPGFALVGDAAHSIHPLAGQGLNLGFADARELAATVECARAGGRDWAGLRALQRYERARRASTLEMGAMTDALFRAFDRRGAGWDAARDFGLRAVSRVAPLRSFLARQAAGA